MGIPSDTFFLKSWGCTIRIGESMTGATSQVISADHLVDQYAGGEGSTIGWMVGNAESPVDSW